MAKSFVAPAFTRLALFFVVGVSALSPPEFQRLPTGSITPKGWLLEQLKLQAEGLSGHLSQFWPDVMSSIWIGGKEDGGLRENAPYWLNGFVPLAYLLKNANVTTLPGPKGVWHQRRACASLLRPAADCQDIPAIEPLRQVDAYVSYILSHRNARSGWLGPDDQTDREMHWAPSNVLLSLMQYAEAEPAKSEEAVEAMVGHLLEVRRRLGSVPLVSWAKARWIDMAYATEWLLSGGFAGGHEAELDDLLRLLHEQGEDWDAVFLHPNGQHNVNVAQGLKSAAVEQLASDGSNDSHFAALSRQRMDTMDSLFGLPNGMYIGDELLPLNATRNPSRGIELCGVVEAMFSYSVMFGVHGDVAFADRAELIAYNALPATWASPRGGDMWAHQYLQAVNEINAIKSDPHIWPNDGPVAETYGLEPNFGCCTANFNQGWPKFANAVIFTVDRAGEEGIVVAFWAPAAAVTPYGHIDIDTSYPFGDDAVVTVQAVLPISLYLRVPAWAVDAEVQGKPVQNGTMLRIPCAAGKQVVTMSFKPRIRIEAADDTPGTAYSVHRGSLMYALPLGLNWTTTGHHYAESFDYEVRPTTPWAFALDADPAHPAATLAFASRGYSYPDAPFNSSGWPVQITATLRPVLSGWTEEKNSAAAPPRSPACAGNNASHCGAPEQATLVPYGSTVLRISVMPLTGTSSSAQLVI